MLPGLIAKISVSRHHVTILAGMAFCVALDIHRVTGGDPPRDIYQHSVRATAWIETPTTQGTGFLVDRSQRLLVTNHHVAQNHGVVNVSFPVLTGNRAVADRRYYIKYDRPVRGYIIARDPERDLAVVQLEVVPHAAATLRLSRVSPRMGETVYLIGNPGAEKKLWIENVGTVWRVGPDTRKVLPSRRELHALIVSVRARGPVLPGYSGGPVVNANGTLVGVTSMSNYATAASERTLREVIALLAAEASGTATGSACLCLVPNDTQHLAFCIDAREVEDVIHIVRSGVERAGKLLEPRSAGDYRARGSHFIRKSRLDLAIPAYSEAIRLDPGNNRAYFDRAMAYRAQRNFGLAIADFTHALRIEPQNSEMLDALAATYAEGGKFDEAVECQRKALAFAGAERKVEFESRLKQYEAHAAARSK